MWTELVNSYLLYAVISHINSRILHSLAVITVAKAIATLEPFKRAGQQRSESRAVGQRNVSGTFKLGQLTRMQSGRERVTTNGSWVYSLIMD